MKRVNFVSFNFLGVLKIVFVFKNRDHVMLSILFLLDTIKIKLNMKII